MKTNKKISNLPSAMIKYRIQVFKNAFPDNGACDEKNIHCRICRKTFHGVTVDQVRNHLVKDHGLRVNVSLTKYSKEMP